MNKTKEQLAMENEILREKLFDIWEIVKTVDCSISDCESCIHENWNGNICIDCNNGSQKEVEK